MAHIAAAGVITLPNAVYRQQAGAVERITELLLYRLPHNDVDTATLIFQRDKDDTLRGLAQARCATMPLPA